MQVLDKVVYDALIDKMVKAAYGGLGHGMNKERRRKRMQRALAAALKDMGLTLGELP